MKEDPQSEETYSSFQESTVYSEQQQKIYTTEDQQVPHKSQ